MNNLKRKHLEDLKDYCIKYIDKMYGLKNNYIKKTRITKNGLFIYGHKVYAPGYDEIYDIYTFINFYDCDDYNFIDTLLDNFVLDCKRLREV